MVISIEKEEEEAEKAAEKAEEKEEKGESGASGESEKIQYIRPIRVKCGVAVTGLEWTTEVTNERLEVSTFTEESEFDKVGLELDHRLV